MKPKWIARSASEIAEFFGVSQQCVGLWRAAGLPGHRGLYDLSACFKWWREREEKRRSDAAIQVSPEAEFRRWRAALTKLRFEVESAKYMPVCDHDSFIVRLISWFRDRLLHQFSGTLAPRIEGVGQDAMAGFLEDEFRTFLQDLVTEAESFDPRPVPPASNGTGSPGKNEEGG